MAQILFGGPFDFQMINRGGRNLELIAQYAIILQIFNRASTDLFR